MTDALSEYARDNGIRWVWLRGRSCAPAPQRVAVRRDGVGAYPWRVAVPEVHRGRLGTPGYRFPAYFRTWGDAMAYADRLQQGGVLALFDIGP